MKFNYKFSSKPEKTIAALTASVVLAILFDGRKKKKKHPEKYKSFPKRTAANYRKIDDLLKRTAAKELYSKQEHYESPVLENIKIEKGEFIDL